MNENNLNENEKTRIVNSGDTSNQENESRESIENNEKLKSLKESNEKNASKGVSKGMFAAGVAAAAVGGVATGAVFSEEIKDVVTPNEPTEHGAVADASQALKESVTIENESIEASVNETQSEVQEVSNEELSENEVHVHYTDSGGAYEVSITDVNGDGNFDEMHVEAELIDGSHIEYAASGTALDSLMNSENFQIADNTDYYEQASQSSFDGFSAESIGASEYHIQSGDTLSEIAEMHGTSVAHIMELNPSITDPNVIMAGEEILIPENDQVSGPYDGWQPEWSDSTDDLQDYTNSTDGLEEFGVDEINVEDNYEVGSIDESYDMTDTGETYESMDWQSFEDQPMEDYASSLNQEDFGSYDSPDSAYDTNYDSGFDFV